MEKERIDFVYELKGELVLFPYGVGKGTGYIIDRASPNRYPYWVIQSALNSRRIVPVHDDAIHLALLKLPRNKHD
jgi:hypothetical protein